MKVWQGQIPKMVALPFIINLIANFSFTPVQFGLSNLPLASFVILVVLITIPWAMVAVWPHAKWVAYMQIPYLLWVLFATVLQLTVTYLNA
jgi:tryptophan-rich sensory protein